jgi:hypothetical protein
MREILLGMGVVVFIVYAVVSTAYMMNAGRTSAAVRYIVKSAGGNLNTTLLELQGTLWNVNKITSDISTVRRDVRQIADTVIKLEKDVRYLYQYLKNELGAAAGEPSPD